jgi:hypothetical protein
MGFSTISITWPAVRLVRDRHNPGLLRTLPIDLLYRYGGVDSRPTHPFDRAP